MSYYDSTLETPTKIITTKEPSTPIKKRIKFSPLGGIECGKKFTEERKELTRNSSRFLDFSDDAISSKRTEGFNIFSSDKNELRKKLINKKFCKNIIKYGKCTIEGCSFAHSIDTFNPKCIFEDVCKYQGTTCIFLHPHESFEEYCKKFDIPINGNFKSYKEFSFGSSSRSISPNKSGYSSRSISPNKSGYSSRNISPNKSGYTRKSDYLDTSRSSDTDTVTPTTPSSPESSGLSCNNFLSITAPSSQSSEGVYMESNGEEPGSPSILKDGECDSPTLFEESPQDLPSPFGREGDLGGFAPSSPQRGREALEFGRAPTWGLGESPKASGVGERSRGRTRSEGLDQRESPLEPHSLAKPDRANSGASRPLWGLEGAKPPRSPPRPKGEREARSDTHCVIPADINAALYFVKMAVNSGKRKITIEFNDIVGDAEMYLSIPIDIKASLYFVKMAINSGKRKITIEFNDR